MIKTKRVLSLLFALAMLVSVLGSGALAANYEPVSIAEGEPVTITWSGTEGAVVSVDGSGYIPASFVLWVEGSDTITVDGVSQPASYVSAEGENYAFEITTKITAMEIVAVSGGVTYTVTCPAKTVVEEDDETPTALNGYLPIGQYASGSAWGSPYSDGTASAGSTAKVAGGYSATGVSLGAAGGYVEYDMNVTNSDTTPYGVDFIVYGNAFVNNPEAASVKVYGTPENGTAGWYELAGSLYYADETLRNVDVTYKKVAASDGEFGSAGIWYRIDRDGTEIRDWTKFTAATNTSVTWWPEESEGYLGANGVWGGVDDVAISADQTEITYQNVTLIRDTDATPDHAFGYADVTPNGSSYGTPVNPYTYNATGGNAYDISWAVDDNGEPVRLSTISKVRVYTSAALNVSSADAPIFTVPSIFGETSAEVCGIYAVTGTGTGTETSVANAALSITGVTSPALASTITTANTYEVAADEDITVSVAVENDYIPVIKYKVGTTGEEQQASLQLLTVTCSPSSKTKNQPIYLVSLPYGSILTDWDISGGKENYKTSMYVLGSNSKNNGGNTADNPAFPGDDYYIIGSSFGIDAYSDVTSVKNDQPCYYRYFINMLDGTSLPIPTTETLTGAAYQIKIQQTGTTTTLAYPTVVVQISTVESSGTVSTEELQAEIKKVTGDNEANWHRENDRYNGRDTSTNGFWMDMQAALAVANNCIGNPGTQDIVDAAKASLSDAISKLIPTTQVNATGLYEAVQAYEKLNESDYTSGSWALRSEAVAKAEAMLAELFDEDGDATDANTAGRQAEADALAEEAAKGEVLVPKGAYDEYYGTYQARLQEARNLVDQYDPSRLTAADYTEESWKAYEAAWETLRSDVNHTFSGGTRADYRMIGQFPNHISALTNARLQLAGSGDVTFSFTYVDNMRSRYPDMGEATAVYRTDSMTLPSGSTTLAAALKKAGITYSTKDIVLPGGGNKSDTDPFLAIYFNGECVGTSYLSELAQSTIQVPNNADVKIVRCVYPLETMEASTGIDSSEWITSLADSSADYADSFALIDMTAPETAAVGDKVKITGSVTGASYSNLGQDLGGEGLTLFVSEPSQTEAFSAPSKETVTVIGADGALEYVFTRPGWYTVALFDQREDVLTATDIFRETTAGTYYSLRAGDFALIHVTQAANPDALLEQYRTEKAAEAERFFAQYHDYDFKAGYYEETFRPLYDGLLANLRAAETFETLMDQYDQDYAALRAAAASAMDHAAILADLRADLALIPGDLSAMDETYKTLVTGIQTAFAGLNDYQKSLLTGNELARLDELADLDADGLRQLADVTVTFYKPGEYEYPFATIQGTFSGTGGAAYYNWPNWNWTSRRQPDGSIPDPDWSDTRAYLERMDAKAGDYVYVRLYLNTTEKQYWPVWSVDGGTTWELFETATYGGVDGYYLATWQVPGDAEDGGSYHIDLKMLSRTEYDELLAQQGAEGLEEAKADALASLQATYDGYDKSRYDEDGLAALAKALEEGKRAIQAAVTTAQVGEARRAAAAAMAAVAKKPPEELEPGLDVAYDSGDTVGSVYVTVENQTYRSGMDHLDGVYVDGWYDLGENDTMMTVILKALRSSGYAWNGTKGSVNPDGSIDYEGKDLGDYTITYIAGISYGDNELAEFIGGPKSGWMGTLNDWFTNEGFASFSVANGRLESGDEIHVMYTCSYGDDIGGSWGVQDTSLTSLSVSTGTLTPAFSSGVTEYTLIVPGNTSLKVTYSAANKQYQSRTYLNSYNVDSARYKQSETMAVKDGSVIYVGVGERGWPTAMTGGKPTKYTIQVKTLASAISELPDASAVTLSSYKTYQEIAATLRQQIKSQGYSGDLSRLEALEARVAFYTEIDTVKRLLAELPGSASASDAQVKAAQAKIEAADRAYKALSDEQKGYITVADAANYNALVERLSKLTTTSASTIMGSEEMPEEVGQTEGGSITIAPEATVNGQGEATAKVDAETVDQVLEQAADDSGISSIVVAPEVTGDASKVTVELPRTAVSAIAKNSDLDLTVSTPIAGMEITNEGLAELAAQSGSTVALSAESVTVTGADGAGAGAVKVDVTMNGKSVETVAGGIAVTIPAEEAGPGAVLVVVSGDGTETILKKSIVEADGSHRAVLPGPATVRIVDNGREFVDVSDTFWARDAIDFTTARELFSGTGGDTFSPNGPMTRGMLVTVLYRLEDTAAQGQNGFADVEDGAWYADAVIWASGNEIVNGVGGGLFAPERSITRQELAAMLYRYAGFLGADTSASAAGSLSAFKDRNLAASYAVEALEWAVGAGLMNGKNSTTLDPMGTATRAEVAAILQRLIGLMVP